MCGILGLFSSKPIATDETNDLLDGLSELFHRGPDHEGMWSDYLAGVFLGHRRLSIVDTSPNGNQPLQSHDGRMVICYNGEIYNFHELRQLVEKHRDFDGWHGSSDTEVLLEAISHFGLTQTLSMCRGMYAFALWDRKDKTIHLVRDPIGEKPLYYTIQDGKLLFASELKAIQKIPGLNLSVSADAVGLCLELGYIPSPFTLYREVSKLEPGMILTVKSDEAMNELVASQVRFWDLIKVAQNSRQKRFAGSMDDAVVELNEKLATSIGRQMVADVPVGVLLSGGIDSSTVTAIMQQHSTRPVESFCLGFSNGDRNEAVFAKEIANYLGTSHNEIYIEDREILDLVEKMPSIFDEPFADSSQIPTYLISSLARERVTVALSGDGGDELFGGYQRYLGFRQIAERNSLHTLKNTLKASLYNGQLAAMSGIDFVRKDQMYGSLAKRIILENKVDRYQYKGDIQEYRRAIRVLRNAKCVVSNFERPCDPRAQMIEAETDWSLLEKMCAIDMLDYLQNDILVKVDRSTMANSLESRAPFLDLDVVEFSFSLLDSHKLSGGSGKKILKGVLEKYIPVELWDRPKQGFGAPEGEWLLGPLRQLGDHLFSQEMLEKTCVFEISKVENFWKYYKKKPKKLNTIAWRLFQIQLFLTNT